MPMPRVLPALVTPFDRHGDLDFVAHAHNLRFLWEAGIRGFLVSGSNGEGPYLERGEREALLSTARETFGRRVYLMCGIMAETVREAARQVAEAEAGGADSVLVLTPTTLVRGRTPLVAGYFREVAERSPLPVLLYSVPGNTAYDLPAEAVAHLADHPNIVGMKDSGGDPVKIQRVVGMVPAAFTLYNGASRSVALAVAAGAHGAITGSVNYAARMVLDLVAAARRSPAAAMPLQRRLTELSARVEVHGVAGVKEAAALTGMRPGFARGPVRPIERKAAVALGQALAEAGLVERTLK
jgi:dihydrodipicolinate synthase/N-acetylneuraminate lyase